MTSVGPNLWAEAHAIAETLGRLSVRRRGARTVHGGQHKRQAAGTGTEFWDYRPLTTGEAVERIDWRRSARGDAVFVKRTQAQTALRLYLWADRSPSMNYGSAKNGLSKADYAAILIGALGFAAISADEDVAVLLPEGPGPRGAAGLKRLDAGDGDGLARASGPGVALLASDFLGPASAVGGLIRPAAARGVDGLLIQVVDPAEADFPFQGDILFEGLEGEPARRVTDAQALAADYRAAWTQHCQALEAIAASAGWGYMICRTDKPVRDAVAAVARWLAA